MAVPSAEAARSLPPGLEECRRFDSTSSTSQQTHTSRLAFAGTSRDDAEQQVRAPVHRDAEEHISQLTVGVNDGVVQAIREAVLHDIDKKVKDKIDHLWQRGTEMVHQRQQNHAERMTSLTAEVVRWQQRQCYLGAENEHLKQLLHQMHEYLQTSGLGVP